MQEALQSGKQTIMGKSREVTVFACDNKGPKEIVQYNVKVNKKFSTLVSLLSLLLEDVD